ncbi:hypothetical protein [Halostagnicola bangensis]
MTEADVTGRSAGTTDPIAARSSGPNQLSLSEGSPFGLDALVR